MMIKISDNPDEVLDMSLENIDILKNQAHKIRVEEIMRYIKILQEAEEDSKYSKQGRIYLELAVIKMCKIEYDTSMEIMLSRLNKIEESIKNGTIKVSENKIGEINNIKKVNTPTSKPKTESIVKEDVANMESDIEESYGESNITLEMVKNPLKIFNSY